MLPIYSFSWLFSFKILKRIKQLKAASATAMQTNIVKYIAVYDWLVL